MFKYILTYLYQYLNKEILLDKTNFYKYIPLRKVHTFTKGKNTTDHLQNKKSILI